MAKAYSASFRQFVYFFFDKSAREPFRYPGIMVIIEVSTIGQCALS